MDKTLEELQKEIEEKKALEQTQSDNSESVVATPMKQLTDDLANGEVDENRAVSNFKNDSLQKIYEDFRGGKVDSDEGMKQIVNVLSIADATSDQKLRDELKKDASSAMKSYMKGLSYKDEEKKIEHRQKRNEAFYKAFRPILEFDLSHLIGKKRRRVVEKDPQTRKKTVHYEQVVEEPPKTYQDRSYGLVLMFIMIGLFIVPYCIANVVLAIGRMVNAMFECFAQFGRTAFWLCTSIAGMAIIGLVIYVLLLIIQAAFGVQIFA